jgi:hypothetical protein
VKRSWWGGVWLVWNILYIVYSRWKGMEVDIPPLIGL